MPIKTRNACTPDVAALLDDMWWETDVRGVLRAVQTPTLLLVHEDSKWGVEVAEYVAWQMPAAQLRRMPGFAWKIEEQPAWAEQIRDFVGIEHPHPSFETVLATILFTDIVGSTRRQAALGNHVWKTLVERHHALVRELLRRWRGVENDTAGDGFFATFDGPARAIRCALEIADRVKTLGIEIRAGVHTGECKFVDPLEAVSGRQRVSIASAD